MATPRGIAHLSRELVNKLVGVIADPHLGAQRKLDQATSTLDRVIGDAESPAAARRHALVGVIDDAISTAAELTRSGSSRAQIEARLRTKLIDGLAELPGVSIERGR